MKKNKEKIICGVDYQVTTKHDQKSRNNWMKQEETGRTGSKPENARRDGKKRE